MAAIEDWAKLARQRDFAGRDDAMKKDGVGRLLG